VRHLYTCSIGAAGNCSASFFRYPRSPRASGARRRLRSVGPRDRRPAKAPLSSSRHARPTSRAHRLRRLGGPPCASSRAGRRRWFGEAATEPDSDVALGRSACGCKITRRSPKAACSTSSTPRSRPTAGCAIRASRLRSKRPRQLDSNGRMDRRSWLAPADASRLG